MARPASISRETAREIHGLCKTGSAKKDLAARFGITVDLVARVAAAEPPYEWLEDDLVSYRLLGYLPKLGAPKAAFLASIDPEGCRRLAEILEGAEAKAEV